MAVYDRKLIDSTTSDCTMPERASTSSTRQMICRSLAPMACAASMTPRGTSRRLCSTSRAKYGMAAQASGTEAAMGPMDVPTSQRVNGTRATSRMTNGNERTMLTSQLTMANSTGFCIDWPGLSRNSQMPSGPPSSTAADRPTPIITSVSPMASQSSGSTSTRVGGSMASRLSSICISFIVPGRWRDDPAQGAHDP